MTLPFDDDVSGGYPHPQLHIAKLSQAEMKYCTLLLFGWAFTRQLTHFLRGLMPYNSPLDSVLSARGLLHSYITWQQAVFSVSSVGYKWDYCITEKGQVIY